MTQKPPCDYEKLAFAHYGDSNPCTPVEEDDENFRGLKINGPPEVFFGPGTSDPFEGGFTRMVIAGVCRLPYPALGLRGEWSYFVVFVATDTTRKEIFAGAYKPFGSPAMPRDPLEKGPDTPDDFKTVIAGSYFNPNLVRDLSLPEREATYDVFATLGPYKSNSVRIKLSRKK